VCADADADEGEGENGGKRQVWATHRFGEREIGGMLIQVSFFWGWTVAPLVNAPASRCARATSDFSGW